MAVRAASMSTPSAMRAPANWSFMLPGLLASNTAESTIQLVFSTDASAKMPLTVRVCLVPFFHVTSTGSPTFRPSVLAESRWTITPLSASPSKSTALHVDVDDLGEVLAVDRGQRALAAVRP